MQVQQNVQHYYHPANHQSSDIQQQRIRQRLFRLTYMTASNCPHMSLITKHIQYLRFDTNFISSAIIADLKRRLFD